MSLTPQQNAGGVGGVIPGVGGVIPGGNTGGTGGNTGGGIIPGGNTGGGISQVGEETLNAIVFPFAASLFYKLAAQHCTSVFLFKFFFSDLLFVDICCSVNY